jgi:hypothetical protein
VSADPKQQGDDYPTDWRPDATSKRQRRDRGGTEVKRDGNEVGDRNH